ncbi:MAG: cupin domain-containing protein [Gammaproteobacteria bacterium]|nr:cupin domain-containing protein [Gammaproteobacteria bacterium]
MESEIGQRLRNIRTQLGLSQRQLSRQSGVANATISQIEAGKLNPTVGMLKKVLDGVPISLGEFFGDEFEARDRVFFRADELTEIADGGVSFRQVGTNLQNRAIQLLKEQYQPGAGTGKHEITHEGEECGIILSGRLEVVVGEQTAVLTAGDAYYFKSNQPHSFRNSGNQPCELITACTPPTF